VTALLALAATLALAGTPALAGAATPGATVPQGGPERVTLQEALRRALARNPSVTSARAEIDRSEALITQARSGMYPTLTGNGTYTRLDKDRAINGNVIAHENQVIGNLQLTVPLLAPLAWAQTWRADSNRRVAISSAADVSRQIAVSVARAYLTVMAQHRVITVNENAAAAAKAHFDFAHTRLVGGIGRAIDEVRAEQELRSDEVAVENAYAGLTRLREALGVLLAADSAVDSVDDVALGDAPTLDAALGEARVRRLDIKAVESHLAATQRLVKDEWVYYAPYLSAVGQPFYQAVGATGPQPKTGWQAQLILTLPLYDGGLRGGIARERDALVTETRADLDAALRQAQSEVRSAFDTMVRADRGLIAARNAARLAERALELANVAYKAGATTNLEVIDAAHAALGAETAAAQAEDAARQARLDLLVSSGRFP
jgi:outer membrane protein TolC